MKNMTFRKSLTAAAVAASLGFPALAIAQDAQTDVNAEEEVERIQVTGSRISRTDIETASPVQIVSREDIEATGLISIGDILQQIPAAGAALNTAFNNGGNGSTTLDLRNLGAQRLLVLVNGRRWISSLGSTVDMNTIPTAAIERVEVLKDGASAVYGSDAIAGVVNIITRQDFNGVEMSLYGGENLSNSDGRQYSADLTFGTTNADSGILFNLSHVTQKPIWAGDRDISSFGTSTTTPNGRIRLWQDSIDASTAAYLDSQGATLRGTTGDNPNPYYDVVPDGEGGLRDRTSSDVYNYAPANYLVTPQERNSFYVQAFKDISSNVRLVSDFVVTNRKSAQELAPMPVTLGASFGASASTVDIGAGNQFNPFNQDLFGSAERAPTPDGYQPYALQRRFLEAGPRRYEQNDITYRAMVGLEGFFDNGWTWDASYIYGKSSQDELTTGLLNLAKINQGLSSNCNSASGCVPLNLLGGEGTITQEMVDFVSFDGVTRAGSEIKDYTFNIAGDLFAMPAGMVGAAFGLERREESGFDTPDPITVSGETSGNQRDATSGSFRLDEAYAEFSIPLHETLLLSPAIRYSDHSAYGSNNTAKLGAEFRPHDDIMFRATWAEGYRAPSISDLYAGNSDSYPTLTDPCNGGEAGNPELPGCAGIPGAYEQANTQIRETRVSSPDLEPETSTSKTFGIVYNPSWLEGAELTLDYYEIEVENAIGRIGSSRLLNDCAEDPASYACDYVDRDAAGNITDIRNFLQNQAEYLVEGIDVFLGYRFDVQDYGSFRTTLDASYVMANEYNGEDQVGVQYGDAGYPEWKANFSLDWMINNDWSVHWATRFVDGMDNYYDVLGYTPFYPGIQPYMGSYTKHDASVKYAFNDNLEVSFGINNLFAKEPPVEYYDGDRPSNDFAVSTNNFSVTEYDVNMDQFYYARIKYRF